MDALRVSFVGAGLCLLCASSVADAPPAGADRPKIDWQKVADGARWGWSEYEASPFYGIGQSGGKYDIRLDVSHRDLSRYAYSIRRDGKTLYSWPGHRNTVFRILDDRLYYAEFHPSASGGDIVAVDLASGTRLWKSPLTGLGGVRHSAYRNLLNLTANHDVVSVYGNESFGRYFEIKDARTGRTIANRIFQKGYAQPQPGKDPGR